MRQITVNSFCRDRIGKIGSFCKGRAGRLEIGEGSAKKSRKNKILLRNDFLFGNNITCIYLCSRNNKITSERICCSLFLKKKA